MNRASGRDRRPYLVLAVLAAASFVALTLIVRARDPFPWELEAFEPVNGWPDWLGVPLWPFMQFGALGSVPVAAALAWWPLRARRLSLLLLTSGLGVYVFAKLVKELVDRGRPADYLPAVVEREHLADGSLGYISGHAAVAATLATLVVAHLPSPWPAVAVGLAVASCIGRMYVGAHLPLDLVGAVALGVAVGAAAAHLGRDRSQRPEPVDVERTS